MREDGRASRRAVLKSGLLTATGAVVGASTAVASTERDRSDEPATVTGRTFPYQFVPGGRFTVIENDADWHPGRVDGPARAHVLEYAHAPSFKAFLFTGPNAALERDRRFAFDGRRASPANGGSNLVAVDVVPLERNGGG